MRNAWAVVAIVCTALVCVTSASIAHVDSAGLLGLIGSLVVPAVSMLLVGHEITRRVGDVEKQVNGRMSQLIASKTTTDPGASNTEG